MTEPSSSNVDQARRQYLDEIRLDGGAERASVQRALLAVPREHFYGPGPWRFAKRDVMSVLNPTYFTTEDDHPSRIYRNASIPLDESRQLLSGHPGLVARYFDQLDVQPGQQVLHMGSGSGYYTALLAELVGPTGRVLATETDAPLAAQARANLAHCQHVEVQHSGEVPGEPASADAILMSFGVTHLEPAWLDRLRDGGRLLASLTVPLNANQGMGVLFKITRSGSEFKADFLQPTGGFSGVGVRDAGMERVLAQAIQSGAIVQATRVRREPHAPDAACVLHRDGACLSRSAASRMPEAMNLLPTMKL